MLEKITFLDEVIFDPDGVHLSSGVALRKLRQYVVEREQDIKNLQEEVVLTEDEQYDLILRLKKLQNYEAYKREFSK